MSSLFGSLSIALRSLLAQQAGLEVTSNNIANVNTPGYSRQRAILRQDPAVLLGDVQFGTGVSLDKVESIRDRVLELRIHQETQQQGELEAFLGATQQIEALFNEARGVGLEGALSALFNSFSALAANPTSVPLRQGTLTAAQNLASALNRAAADLATQQTSIDREITQATGEINQLTAQLAEANRAVTQRTGVGLDAGEAADRREQLLRQLAGLIDISVIDAGDGGVTVTTQGGAALVVADRNIPLQAVPNPGNALRHIFSQNADITASINGGKLGGLLRVRDTIIPGIAGDLDALAAGIATAFNTQHRAGFDLNSAAGADLFVPPAAISGAASSLRLAFTNPALLAASSDGSAGSSGNATAISGLRDQPIVNGQRPADFYQGLVFRLGNETAAAQAEIEAESLVLQQLENQRGALSGVSLDEEAANLLRYQRAFEASARLVSVVDDLTQTTLDMFRR